MFFKRNIGSHLYHPLAEFVSAVGCVELSADPSEVEGAERELISWAERSAPRNLEVYSAESVSEYGMGVDSRGPAESECLVKILSSKQVSGSRGRVLHVTVDVLDEFALYWEYYDEKEEYERRGFSIYHPPLSLISHINVLMGTPESGMPLVRTKLEC